MMALSGMSNETLFRFAVVGKALRLMKHHAYLFQQVIVRNMASSYRMGLVCYFSEKDACKKHAEGALMALLSEFSSAVLLQSNFSSEDEQTLSLHKKASQDLFEILFLLLGYLGTIESEQALTSNLMMTFGGKELSSERKISLGVKGITVLAPAVAIADYQLGSATSESGSCGKIIGILLRSCDNLLLQMAFRRAKFGGNEIEGMSTERTALRIDTDVVLRKSQFLTAISITMYSILCCGQKEKNEMEDKMSYDGSEGGEIVHIDQFNSSISIQLLNFLLTCGVDIVMSYNHLWGVSAPSTARCALCVFLRAVAFTKIPSNHSHNLSSAEKAMTTILSCSSASVSSVLDESLKALVPLLLLRSMSRDEEEHSVLSSNDMDKRLHGVYLPLWRELLNPQELETSRLLVQMTAGEKADFASYQRMVFPPFVNAVFSEIHKIIQAFDLSYITPSSVQIADVECSDAERTSETDMIESQMLLPLPNNAADQELLLNLVSLLEAICPVLASQLRTILKDYNLFTFQQQFSEWITMLLAETVELAKSWPMVSGLYRLCKIFISILYALKSSGGAQQQPMDCGIFENESTLENALMAFFEETATNILSVFHHPELISSSLNMVFAAPVALITKSILVKKVYLPLIIVALRTGVEVPSALKILFEYFDFDSKNSISSRTSSPDTRNPADTVLTDDILRTILPLLDRYLITSTSLAEGDIEGKRVSKSKLKKKNRTIKTKNGLSTNADNYMVGGTNILLNDGVDTDESANNPEAGDVQRIVLRFLARLGGRNKLLLKSASNSISSTVKWACFDNQLSVHVPVTSNILSNTCRDNSSQLRASHAGSLLEVNVGVVVPRLVDLCTDLRCENRQLRLYAQECLHGVVLLMIGKVTHFAKVNQDQADYCMMFNSLFPVLIRLSVSEDDFTRKIFDKLLFQIIHWLNAYCESNSLSDDIFSTLIDHLLDGVTGNLVRADVSDASPGCDVETVNKCVKAVVECFRWACKRTGVSKADHASSGSSTTSVDGILSRLLTLSSHPMEQKRVGAIEVLNHLYVYFREDTHLVQKYVLRVLFVLLNAVKQPGQGSSQATCALAVGHYVKIIVRLSQKDELDAAYIRLKIFNC